MPLHIWADAVLCPLQCLAGVEGLAILTSADFLLDIQRLALDNDIEPSPSCVGGWKVWAQAVRSLGQGIMPPGSSGVSLHLHRSPEVCASLQGKHLPVYSNRYPARQMTIAVLLGRGCSAPTKLTTKGEL